MYFLRVDDQKCELYSQQEQLLLQYEKGELTEKVYNALNDRTLRILDNQVIAIPGLYRGTDAGSGRTQLYPISDVDYLSRVRRQSPFMRQLLAIFKPSAPALKIVYIQVLHTFYQQIPLEDNNLMYTIKYTDDDQMVEEKYKYGTNPDIINIEDFTALIGYDLQFLKQTLQTSVWAQKKRILLLSNMQNRVISASVWLVRFPNRGQKEN